MPVQVLNSDPHHVERIEDLIVSVFGVAPISRAEHPHRIGLRYSVPEHLWNDLFQFFQALQIGIYLERSRCHTINGALNEPAPLIPAAAAELQPEPPVLGVCSRSAISVTSNM